MGPFGRVEPCDCVSTSGPFGRVGPFGYVGSCVYVSTSGSFGRVGPFGHEGHLTMWDLLVVWLFFHLRAVWPCGAG